MSGHAWRRDPWAWTCTACGLTVRREAYEGGCRAVDVVDLRGSVRVEQHGIVWPHADAPLLPCGDGETGPAQTVWGLA